MRSLPLKRRDGSSHDPSSKLTEVFCTKFVKVFGMALNSHSNSLCSQSRFYLVQKSLNVNRLPSSSIK